MIVAGIGSKRGVSVEEVGDMCQIVNQSLVVTCKHLYVVLHVLCSGLCDGATSVTCFCASAMVVQAGTRLEGDLLVQSTG